MSAVDGRGVDHATSSCPVAVTSDAATGRCGEMRDGTPTSGRSPAVSRAVFGGTTQP